MQVKQEPADPQMLQQKQIKKEEEPVDILGEGRV